MQDPAANLIVSASELCEHWSLTPRRFRELVADGVAVRSRAGFDLVESDRRYIAKLRSNDESRRLKARLIERQTQRHELKLLHSSGTLMLRSEAQQQCESWWGDAWAAVQAAISRLYHSIPGDDNSRRATCWRFSDDVRGELLLHRDRIAGVFLAPPTPRTLDQHLRVLGLDGSDPEGELEDEIEDA
jgi:hypothetical protein